MTEQIHPHPDRLGNTPEPAAGRTLAPPWLDDAAAAYRAMPPDDPARPVAAYQLAVVRMLANQTGEHDLDPHEIIALLNEARRDRPDDPLWQRAVAAVLGAVHVHAAVNGNPSFAHEAVELLRAARDLAADNPLAAEEIDMLRQLAAHFAEASAGSAAPPVPVTFPPGDPGLDRLTGLDGLDVLSRQRLTHRIQTAVIDAQRARSRGDRAAMAAAVADLEAATLLLPATDTRRATAEANLAVARIWQAEMSGTPPRPGGPGRRDP